MHPVKAVNPSFPVIMPRGVPTVAAGGVKTSVYTLKKTETLAMRCMHGLLKKMADVNVQVAIAIPLQCMNVTVNVQVAIAILLQCNAM
ncbi:hypothetical protein SUGI_0036650 [Cryptomeria japonica]|nr:hypothetical protein SUGI_0036650 [Cryptomeria japonica]